jgi:DNA repair exonuclease SbcCD ATPase subunit
MDEGSLRKQITAEVREQFDTQLREMRHEKNRAEEELESGAERWRTERRKLNSEIDRLEEEATSRSKKPSAVAIEDLEYAIQPKLREATAALESERDRLKTEISRLESALAEALARSGNPIRITQMIKDQYEVKLAEANRVHLNAERDFLRTKSDWEADKSRMIEELTRLRQRVPPNGGSQARQDSLEEIRIRELEGQLAEARSTVLRSQDGALKSSEEVIKARKEVEKLNGILLEMCEHLGVQTVDQLRHEYDAKVRNLVYERDRLLQASSLLGNPPSGPDPMALAPLLMDSMPAATEAIKAEVERVESLIDAIEKLLDDPDTSASTIALKNNERAQLEAYIRGIRFQAARSKGA